MPLPDAVHDDLTDFVRHGSLDAYELTDDELAQMLEVWRWSAWRRMHRPSAPDHDIIEQSQRLQRRLAHEHNLEVEYNTTLLLKQELEPLMHLRILLSVPRALIYFLRPRRILALWLTLRRVTRYQRFGPMCIQDDGEQEYPLESIQRHAGRPPDLLKRPYWRQLSHHSFAMRKRLDLWW
ncbi:MAG: hypothetical protein KC547_05130 [Anaerolineae bacterium]|nr:hypothetical protein [Anaerolineae bacterium]